MQDRAEFGLRKAFCTSKVDVACADPKCGRLVGYGSTAFVDELDGSTYCEPCGKCLRYSRRKAAERTPEREALVRRLMPDDESPAARLVDDALRSVLERKADDGP